MKKLVTLTEDANHHALKNVDGISPKPEYFSKFIENKALRVVSELRDIATVADEEGEEWTVKRAALVVVPKFFSVGQELTQGRSAVHG